MDRQLRRSLGVAPPTPTPSFVVNPSVDFQTPETGSCCQSPPQRSGVTAVRCVIAPDTPPFFRSTRLLSSRADHRLPLAQPRRRPTLMCSNCAPAAGSTARPAPGTPQRGPPTPLDQWQQVQYSLTPTCRPCCTQPRMAASSRLGDHGGPEEPLGRLELPPTRPFTGPRQNTAPLFRRASAAARRARMALEEIAGAFILPRFWTAAAPSQAGKAHPEGRGSCRRPTADCAQPIQRDARRVRDNRPRSPRPLPRHAAPRRRRMASNVMSLAV